MRQNLLAVLILAGAAGCVAQTGGYGNILYPGGKAPAVPVNSLSGGYHGNGSHGGYAASHPAHGRGGVVPYPVVVGGYYYGGNGYYADPSQQDPNQEAPPPLNAYGAPSVVINQTFIPDHATPSVREYGDGADASAPDPSSGLRVYEGPKPPTYPAPQKKDDLPTIYLIAFKDHTIVQALGYWVEKGALQYVSAEHTVNQASLDLIDRDLTQRLNDERNVEFKLPKN